MFVAAGLGALFAARFQLIAHAVVKAVLVLGAGSVRRATGDESDLARRGGIGWRMRWTAGAFGIGTLALIGIPPAAGFFGIAAIVSAAFSESDALLTALVLLAVAASAFAGVRLFALMFAAPPAAVRATDAPRRLQDVSLVLLAIGALAFGALVSAGLLPIGSGPADEAPAWLLGAIFAVVLASSIAAWLGYHRGLRGAERIERAMRWARGGLGVDALYDRAVAIPFRTVARELDEGAERVNDQAVAGVGTLAQRGSDALRGAIPASARAQHALLLVGTVVLLAFWTWSAR